MPRLVLVVALAAAVGVLHVARRPDLNCTAAYVTGEDGNQLWRAHRLNSGAVLYRDVACQYGYVPAYAHAAWAAAFGNTILSNRLWHLLTSLACVGLMFRLLRTFALPTVAAAWTLVVAVPFLLVPGGAVGAYTNFEHTSLERMCLLGVMLSWVPPGERSSRAAVMLGLILGLWQGVKFGGAFFAGAAFVAVDVLWLLREGGYTRWLRRGLVTLAAFAAVEAAWVALAVATLPPAIALDTLWPAYVGRSYHWGDGFGWNGVVDFACRPMVPLVCMVLGAFVLFRRPGPATVGLFFFAFGSVGYFGHVHLYYSWAWAAVPAGLAGFLGLPRPVRLVVGVLLLPAALLMLKVVSVNRPAGTPVELPTGELILVSPADAATLARLAELPIPEGKFALCAFDWGGGGVHFYFDRGYGLRNPMLMWPAFRDYDIADLERNRDRIAVVVVRDADWAAFERDLLPRLPLAGFHVNHDLSGNDLTVLTPSRR
jgi:hypothetical protein